MANVTVESLNFELLLDDGKFNKQISTALAEAQKLNTSLSSLLNLRKQFNAAAKQGAKDEADYAKAVADFTRKLNAQRKEVDKGTTALHRYNQEGSKVKQFNVGGNFSAQRGALNDLTSLAAQYVSILGAARLVKSIVQVTSEFELQRTTLRAILNDMQGADEIFEQIKSLAVVSPFSFKELVTYTKQLSAYSIPINDLYQTTKMLADVSAGLGIGMDRLVLAYGQIRSASFLRGFNIYGLSASEGVKNTNPFNCWDSLGDNQQPRCLAA